MCLKPVCLEALRRMIIYNRGLLEYLNNRRQRQDMGRVSVKGIIEAIRALIENCPMDQEDKEYWKNWIREAEMSPWQTVAEFMMGYNFLNKISMFFLMLEKQLGFKPEDYEKYIP